jgi:hypothetical protein
MIIILVLTAQKLPELDDLTVAPCDKFPRPDLDVSLHSPVYGHGRWKFSVIIALRLLINVKPGR